MRNDGYVVQCYRSCLNLRSSCTVRPLSAPVLHMYLCFAYRNFLPQQISLSPSVRGKSRLTFHDSFRLLPLWQERPIIICISTFHIKSLRPLKLESLGTLVIQISYRFHFLLPWAPESLCSARLSPKKRVLHATLQHWASSQEIKWCKHITW